MSFSETITGEGNRIEQALDRQEDGVLPLRPDWLAANCPDLWPTEEAAKKDVARKRGQTSNMNKIRGMSLFEYEYKLKGQRRWSRCLSRLLDYKATGKSNYECELLINPRRAAMADNKLNNDPPEPKRLGDSGGAKVKKAKEYANKLYKLLAVRKGKP